MLTIPNEIFFEAVADELQACGTVLLKVKGASMFPFFRSGKDSALLKKYDPSTPLAKGDVALFRFNSRHILHRCVGKGLLLRDGRLLTGRAAAHFRMECASGQPAQMHGAQPVCGGTPGQPAQMRDAQPVYIFRGDGNLSGLEWAAEEDVLAVLEKRIAPSGREWGCGSFSWKLCSALWPRSYVPRRLLLALLNRLEALLN